MDKKINSQFVINFEDKSSFCFHSVTQNYFVKEILTKRNDKKSKQLFFRLLRVGIIGDILYKAGEKKMKSEEHSSECEFLAALFESYIFLVRTLYDYFLHLLKNKHGIKENSFNKFVKKIKKGDYPEIKGKLRERIIKDKVFEEIRSLRDSIKQRTPYIFVYVKENKYYVDGTIYKRDGTQQNFDELLSAKIFSYSAALLILMSYIAENINGVSLKDQMDYQEKRANN